MGTRDGADSAGGRTGRTLSAETCSRSSAVITRSREDVFLGKGWSRFDMVDETDRHALSLLQPPAHDQDRFKVRDLPVALVDRRPQDDIDVAELVGQREELEFLAGRGWLAGGDQV